MSKTGQEVNLESASRLRSVIKESGLSQMKFAEEVLDCSIQHISRMVNGRAPITWETAKKIELYFPAYSANWIMCKSDYQYEELEEAHATIERVTAQLRRGQAINTLMSVYKYEIRTEFVASVNNKLLFKNELFKGDEFICYLSTNQVSRFEYEVIDFFEYKLQRLIEHGSKEYHSPLPEDLHNG